MPVTPDNRRTFAVLTLLKWLLLRIAPQSQWANRFRELLKNYPDIPLESGWIPTGMGYVADLEMKFCRAELGIAEKKCRSWYHNPRSERNEFQDSPPLAGERERRPKVGIREILRV